MSLGSEKEKHNKNNSYWQAAGAGPLANKSENGEF
jgi:hypothetical protein